jgi:hypothetical protein
MPGHCSVTSITLEPLRVGFFGAAIFVSPIKVLAIGKSPVELLLLPRSSATSLLPAYDN